MSCVFPATKTCIRAGVVQPYRTCTIQGAKGGVGVYVRTYASLSLLTSLYVCSLHTAVKLFARKAALMGLPPPVSPHACCTHRYTCRYWYAAVCFENAGMVKAGFSSYVVVRMGSAVRDVVTSM